MAGFELPLKAMRSQIVSAVDLIVRSNRIQGGKRKITQITEVVGMEQDTVVMQDIYRYEQEGVDEQGRAYSGRADPNCKNLFFSKLKILKYN